MMMKRCLFKIPIVGTFFILSQKGPLIFFKVCTLFINEKQLLPYLGFGDVTFLSGKKSRFKEYKLRSF